MVKTKSYKLDKTIRNDIEPLFISAFPREERPPVDYFFSSFDNNKINNLYGFYDKNDFIGFSSVIIYKDICYIFFLAVEEEYRNQGYGTKILNELKKLYKDYILLLCYEYLDKEHPEYEIRKKREQFYLKNGFKKNPLITEEFGVVFQTAYIGNRKITFKEYQEIFKYGFGEYALKHLKEVKTYKAKCDYCLTEFEYIETSIDYRPWKKEGFVLCPNCGKKIKHIK